MKSSFAFLSLVALAAADATVYLIRHGEKPDSGNGLSAQGMQRAQCLRNVFGANSGYDIQYIMTEDYKVSQTHPCTSVRVSTDNLQSDGKRQRPYDTVYPLSQDLNITIDHHCDKTDQDCAADTIENYDGEGNILLCWEHSELHDIVKALGDKDAPDYPDDRFDIIWVDPPSYDDITDMYSEDCPGLDN